jgi:thioredoxin-like negative regulator of GroEL
MLTPELFRSKFDQGLAYAAYVATGTADQQTSWNAFHAKVRLTKPQADLLASFSRRINVLVSSGTWCGDCVQQVPMLDHIQRANPNAIALRLLDRDVHKDLSDQLKICGGLRVPTVIFLNEDFEFVGILGDAPLSRYRAKAAKQLGASCPLPGADVPADEIAATLQDWVDQFERTHLLLRLSAKLRQRHDD